MFDQMPSRKARGPLPVWPHFFLSAVAAIAGVVLVAVWWPRGFPDKDDLVKFGGDIATVRIKDDISKTSAGAMLPAVTSVYFTFKGQDGEFRYPSTQPGYQMVRDYTSVRIDVWVDRAEIGTGEPMRVWQVEERNPYNIFFGQTFVSYEEIVERLTAIDRSMVEAGVWLLVLSFAFVLIGAGVQRWNANRASWDV